MIIKTVRNSRTTNEKEDDEESKVALKNCWRAKKARLALRIQNIRNAWNCQNAGYPVTNLEQRWIESLLKNQEWQRILRKKKLKRRELERPKSYISYCANTTAAAAAAAAATAKLAITIPL